jgi:hypothetical protein
MKKKWVKWVLVFITLFSLILLYSKELSVTFFIIVGVSFLIAFYFLHSFKNFYIHLEKTGGKISPLFFYFKQKLWMTLGVAIFFALFFIALNLFHKYFYAKETLVQNFLALLEHPEQLLLWGCTLFIVNAVIIILVREIVKTLYHWHNS